MKIISLASIMLPAQVAASYQFKCCSHVKTFKLGEEPACLTPLTDCDSTLHVDKYPTETCKIDIDDSFFKASRYWSRVLESSPNTFPCTPMVFGVEFEGPGPMRMNDWFDRRERMLNNPSMPDRYQDGSYSFGTCTSRCSQMNPVKYGRLQSTPFTVYGNDRTMRKADDFVCWEQLENGGLSPGLGFNNDWQNIQFDPSCGPGSKHTKCFLNCVGSCEYFDADLCLRACGGAAGLSEDLGCARNCLQRVDECTEQGKVPGSALGEPVYPEKCNPKECEDWTCRDWCKCFKAHPEIIEIFEGPNPSASEQAIRDSCPSDGQDDCDCTEFHFGNAKKEVASGICPNGYHAIDQNLEGAGKKWSKKHPDPSRTLQDCADICDARTGCTSFEYAAGNNQHGACGTYTGGKKNIFKNENRKSTGSNWLSCVKN